MVTASYGKRDSFPIPLQHSIRRRNVKCLDATLLLPRRRRSLLRRAAGTDSPGKRIGRDACRSIFDADCCISHRILKSGNSGFKIQINCDKVLVVKDFSAPEILNSLLGVGCVRIDDKCSLLDNSWQTCCTNRDFSILVLQDCIKI